MPGLRDLPGDMPIKGYFPGHATAGTAKECAIGRAPFDGEVTAVSFTPSASITGAATNYFTLTVYNRTTGAGSTVVASLAFDNGSDATAATPKTITLSGTAANLLVNEGDVISVAKSTSGTGLACPDGLVTVHFKGA